MFLTSDGGVFTCGAGMYGQLGHGTSSNEILPRQVDIIQGAGKLLHIGTGIQIKPDKINNCTY